MLRSTRSLWASSARAIASPNPAAAASGRRLTSLPSSRLPNATAATRTTMPRRAPYATIPNKPNPEEEKKWAEEKLAPHPEAVSTESSVRHFIEPNKPGEKRAEPVADGVAHDLRLVKETFALDQVPKEPYLLGLAGTIPYLATSVSNVYLSWALNTEWPTSSNFLNTILMTHDNARYWLSVIEPLQMGYGAVIISFLGAIHWGLEYAEKKPSYPRTQLRYGLGVLASVVAWPTLFMPWHFALTSQFAAFVGLYFADARASVRGWAPYWYGTYRFVLTAIVGVAIMLSLIGRAKIGDTAPRLSGLSEKFHATHGEEPYTAKWAKAEEPARKAEKKRKQEEEKKKKQEEEAQKKKEAEEQKKKEKEEAQEKGSKGSDKNAKSEDSDKKGKKEDESKDKEKEEESGKSNEKDKDESGDSEAKEEGDDAEDSEVKDKEDGAEDSGKKDKKEGKSDDSDKKGKKEDGAEDSGKKGKKESKSDDSGKNSKKEDKPDDSDKKDDE